MASYRSYSLVKPLSGAAALCPHCTPPLQKNHLSGLKRKLLKLSFWNVQQLMEVKRELMPEVMKNKARAKTTQVCVWGC
jgi:hypothetical protein